MIFLASIAYQEALTNYSFPQVFPSDTWLPVLIPLPSSDESCVSTVVPAFCLESASNVDGTNLGGCGLNILKQ